MSFVACQAQAAVPGGVMTVNPRRTKVGFAQDGAVSDFVKAVSVQRVAISAGNSC